ncbi:MAG: type II toxin-antitoxin system RelE/ParE family toxin [Devosia sp.]|nr:type II toxin-antitoxin system RelE/ParE family toxin [Devosia sp.]
MIESFRHKGLKRFYDKGDRSKLPAEMADRIQEILTALDTASDVETMNRPSFRLHPLTGARRGEWSVTVRANWRIVFRFENGSAHDVNFEDYH